ncbi:hypothetical protein [Brevibacterium aurantiacum]|uniref:hypothetical protein n=1 Tax=Brevibacterium aurantiacum TaxID=273384 RepID=UPI00084C2271|nr:hypothetical protein [Brevibacterium aurantiacum]RCS93804.1 hypothetical protein CIK60_18775 [Brevibacterium aurantiacum]
MDLGRSLVLQESRSISAHRHADTTSHDFAGALNYGLLSGTPIHGSWEFPSHVELKYFHLRQDAHNSDPVQFAQRFEEVFRLVASGLLATTPAAKFPLSQIRDALAWNSANRGKVLLESNAEVPR